MKRQQVAPFKSSLEYELKRLGFYRRILSLHLDVMEKYLICCGSLLGLTYTNAVLFVAFVIVASKPPEIENVTSLSSTATTGI